MGKLLVEVVRFWSLQVVATACWFCCSAAVVATDTIDIGGAILAPEQGFVVMPPVLGGLIVSIADPLRHQSVDGQLVRRRSFQRFMTADADLPADLVARIWDEPHSLLQSGDNLQHKLRCSVVKIDHTAGSFIWKYHNWGTAYRAAKRSLARSTGYKSWSDARLLHSAGVSVSRPRAYVECRLGPFQRGSFVLADYIAGTSLYRFMRFERPGEDFVRHLARQFAVIWQQLDDLCVWHNDFKTENFLVDPLGKLWLIDFERMRRMRSRDQARRRQVRDINDFFHPRNWRANPAAAEVFRRELLKTEAMSETLSASTSASHPLAKPRPAKNPPSQLVTVLIPCLNAKDTIEACVESVRDMADEILVADAGSTDRTLQKVDSLGGCRVIERGGEIDEAFLSWAVQQARHPWIFQIWPAEQLNSELSRQVQDTIASEPKKNCYRVLRNVSFRGQLLKHGLLPRSSSIRLFRRDDVRFELRDGHVEATFDQGAVGQLPSKLFFESCSALNGYLNHELRAAEFVAADAERRGIRPSRLRACWRAVWRGLHFYVLRGGWMDGWAGLHASIISAFATYWAEALLWEAHAPALERRVVIRDNWQGLKVFNPDTAVGLPSVLDAGQSMLSDLSSGEAGEEPPRLRSAA